MLFRGLAEHGPLGVSGDGSIIVGMGGNVAWIWDEVHGMRDLKQVLEQDFSLDLTGWLLREARAVSADGLTIVGEGVNPEGHWEAWRAVIPEPNTAALLALGLLVLGVRRRS